MVVGVVSCSSVIFFPRVNTFVIPAALHVDLSPSPS